MQKAKLTPKGGTNGLWTAGTLLVGSSDFSLVINPIVVSEWEPNQETNGHENLLIMVEVILFTEALNCSPVLIRNAKPLCIAWSDVEVNGAEVEILLVGWCSTARNLHI